MKQDKLIGLALTVVGLILVLFVFGVAYHAYKVYEVEVEGGDLASVLEESAGVLVNLLIKIAFLGIALAAGSIILSKGVALLRECPVEEGGAGQS